MSKWISTQDRLPSPGQRVLACNIHSNNQIMICRYHEVRNKSGSGCTCWFFNNMSVTHWMPLPEMPKEDENV